MNSSFTFNKDFSTERRSKMKIHLIEKFNNFSNLRDYVWECGWWKMKEGKAQDLVGGEIYFHKKRLEPSFYGGTIVGYRVEQDGDHQGQTVFEFQYNHSSRNVRTNKYGWSREMKIIEEPEQK
jgi:hypothetical protein